MKRHQLFLAACCLAASCSTLAVTTPTAYAQLPGGVYVVRVLQGQKVRLPADNVARYDGNSLKMVLTSAGLDNDNRNQNLTATLIRGDGSRIEARPDADGIVSFSGIRESGLHALVVTGGSIAYSVMALYLEGPGKPPPADENRPALGEDPAAPAEHFVAAPFEVPLGKIDPTQILGIVESAGNAPKGNALTPLNDYGVDAARQFRASLHPDGTLSGRVVVPEAGFDKLTGTVRLAFLRDGVTVANTVTSADGLFFVGGLGAGMHTVIASGPSGHASFAFEIVPPGVELPALTKGDAARTHPVSTSATLQAASELIVLIVPPLLMPPVRDVVRQAYGSSGSAGGQGAGMLPPPLGGGGGGGFAGGAGGGGGFAGGGFAGGGFAGGAGGGGGFAGGAGGGGGGFAGGGLGALLGIGGLAAGVAALASEDDGFSTPLASP